MKSRFKLNIFTILTLFFGILMIFIGSKEIRIVAGIICMGLGWYIFLDFKKVLYVNDLFDAIKSQNTPKLRMLLSKKLNPDIFDAAGLAPIHYAVDSGKIHNVESLINSGAFLDIMARTNGNTALHIAASKGYLKIAELLLKSKAKVNPQNYSGITPLNEAVSSRQKDVAHLLIEHGGVYQVGQNWTILHEAALKGEMEKVEDLIAQGVNVNIRDDDARRPLHAAAIMGNTGVAKVLINEKADVNAVTRFGENAIHVAAQYGNLDFIRFLDSNGGALILESGKNALHEAAEYGYIDICDFLLNHGILINSKNEKALTALHVAAQKGHEGLVKYLVNKGADINSKNDKGDTPLHMSVYGNNQNIIKLLIAQGANPNVRNDNGETPLHLIDYEGGVEVAKALIQSGAEINIRDKFGYTPLSRATKINNQTLADLFRKNYIAEKTIEQTINPQEPKNKPLK